MEIPLSCSNSVRPEKDSAKYPADSKRFSIEAREINVSSLSMKADKGFPIGVIQSVSSMRTIYWS